MAPNDHEPSPASSGSSAGVTRPWRGVSAADRVDDRRARLLAAGLELFGSRGVAAVGVGDVCTEAGLTKRYFYESFRSIDELVDAVIADAITFLTDRAMPVLVEHGAGDLRPAMATLADAVLADPRIVRLLVVETQGPFAHHRRSLIDGALDTAMSVIWPDHGDLLARARRRVAVRAVAGAVGEVMIAWTDGDIDLTLDELIDFVFDAVASIDLTALLAGAPGVDTAQTAHRSTTSGQPSGGWFNRR